MKAFFVGLLFLIASFILLVLSILFLPFYIAMGLLMQLIVILSLVIFFIWLLGKLIIWVWDEIKK